MRLEKALLGLLVLAAAPLCAADAPTAADGAVREAVRNALQQEGFEATAAAGLADRILERLSESAVSSPQLTENTAPILPSDWKDKLADDVKALQNRSESPVIAPGVEKTFPENVANLVVQETQDAARLVILKHLHEIEASGFMSESIATDRYWRSVFAASGYEDVYDSSRDLLKKALRAGLKPYKEGKGLNAKVFAQLAAAALQAPPAPSLSFATQPLDR
jgi:hypothetical protein